MAPRAVPINLFGNPQQQAPQPSFIDTLLSRFMTGLQIGQTVNDFKRQNEDREQAIQQNKLALEKGKLELAKAQLEAKLAPEETKLRLAQMLAGTPGQMFGSDQSPQQIDVPGMANVPMSLGGPGGYQPSGQTTTFGVTPMQGTVEAPHPETTLNLSRIIPGAQDIHYRPLNQSQTLQQALMQMRAKNYTEAQGAGWKAGAESQAKLPADLALKQAESQNQLGLAQFNQGQENARTKATLNKDLSVAGMNLAATREQRKFEQGNKLSDDFFKETAPFTAMDDAYAKVKAAAAVTPEQDPTGASDVAILYGYMKLLDPNSAVREGEVALAGQTQGIPDRILTMYNNAINGQKLAPAARANFVAAAKKTYEAVQPRLKMIEGRYQDTAKKSGLDPSRFTFQSGASQQPAAPGPIAVNPQTGQKVQWNGSAWVPAQ